MIQEIKCINLPIKHRNDDIESESPELWWSGGRLLIMSLQSGLFNGIIEAELPVWQNAYLKEAFCFAVKNGTVKGGIYLKFTYYKVFMDIR